MNRWSLQAPGSLLWESSSLPEPAGAACVVRIEAATTCGTDLKAWRRGHPAIPMPGPFGHEYTGIIERAGPESPFAVGTGVMGVHTAPLGDCEPCRRGHYNLCEHLLNNIALGSYGERFFVPDHIARVNLFPRPAELPVEIACVLEPLSCVVHAIERIPKEAIPGSVLIVGPGSIGQLFARAFPLLRPGTAVHVGGRNPARLERAAASGAQIHQWETMSQASFDAVVECTGQVDVWQRAINFVSPGGTLVLFGGPPAGTTWSLDTHRLHYDDLRIQSPFHFTPAAVASARDLLIQHAEKFADVVDDTRPMSALPQTLADMASGAVMKVALIPEGS